MDNQLTELMDKPEFKYAKTALARWKGYKADELKVGAWLDVLDALDIALQIIDCMAAHPSPVAPSTEAGAIILEPVANYVVYDGTAYGPFWSFELATLYRQQHYPNGLVRDGKSKDVLLCKRFVDVIIDAPQAPAPNGAATAKLTKNMLDALRYVFEHDKWEGWAIVRGYVYIASIKALSKKGLVEVDYPKFINKAKITDLGRAALAALR